MRVEWFGLAVFSRLTKRHNPESKQSDDNFAEENAKEEYQQNQHPRTDLVRKLNMNEFNVSPCVRKTFIKSSVESSNKSKRNSLFNDEYLRERPETEKDRRLPVEFDGMSKESCSGNVLSMSTGGAAESKKGPGTTDGAGTQKKSLVSPRNSTQSPSSKNMAKCIVPTASRAPPSPFSKTKLAKLLMKNGLTIDLDPELDSTSRAVKGASFAPVVPEKSSKDPMSPKKSSKVPGSPKKSLPDSPRKQPSTIAASLRRYPNTPSSSKASIAPGKGSMRTPSKVIHLKTSKAFIPPLIPKRELPQKSSDPEVLETGRLKKDTSSTTKDTEKGAKRGNTKPTKRESGSNDNLLFWDDEEGEQEVLDFDDLWEDTAANGQTKKFTAQVWNEGKQDTVPICQNVAAEETETEYDKAIESEYGGDDTEYTESDFEDETDYEGSERETETEHVDEINSDEVETEAEETETETEIDSTEENPEIVESMETRVLATLNEDREGDSSEIRNAPIDGEKQLSRQEMIEKMRALQTKFSDVLGRLSGAAEKLRTFDGASNDIEVDYSSDGSLTVSTIAVQRRISLSSKKSKDKLKKSSKKSSKERSPSKDKSLHSKSSKKKSSKKEKSPKERSTKGKSGKSSKKRREPSSMDITLTKLDSIRTYDTFAWE